MKIEKNALIIRTFIYKEIVEYTKELKFNIIATVNYCL